MPRKNAPPPAEERGSDDQVAHVDLSVDLMPGERVQIILDAEPGSGGVRITRRVLDRAAAVESEPAETPASPGAFRQRARVFFSRVGFASPQTLLSIGLLIYLLVRLIGIVEFPIYFSPDEAVHPLAASKMLTSGLRDDSGEFLPTFFKNDGHQFLGTSIYFHAIPVLLFGKSIWVARASVALFSLLVALWIAWMARDHFKLSTWWLAPLVLSILPAWFLLTRTGYEYALMVTFYAGFLYYYLRYRLENPRFLFAALALGALAFYTAPPGQVIMVATGIGLLVSDARFHWQNRRIGLAGIGMIALLALPLVRFWLASPLEYASHLAISGSYLAQDMTAGAKVGEFLGYYLSGLNPLYWFLPNDADPLRFRMPGYAHLTVLLLPLVAAGVVLAARQWRQPHMRLALIAMLAAPVGGAVVGLTAPRALTIVIPAVLLALLALDAGISRLARQAAFPRSIAHLGLVLALAFANLATLVDALTRGPTWATDYGLDGLQWGARQVYATVREVNRANPAQRILISPNWTYQGHTLRNFFLPPEAPVEIGSADAYLETVEPALSDWLFVLTPEDMEKIETSQRFKNISIERTVIRPDGEPGFFFTRLTYRDDIESFLEAERTRRFAPVPGRVIVDQQILEALHSPLDMGELQNIFDGDPATLMRTSGANPLVVELAFPEGRALTGLTARVGAEPVRLTVTLTSANEAEARTFSVEAGEVDGYKEVSVPFGETLMVTRLRLELLDVFAAPISNVHLWEVALE